MRVALFGNQNSGKTTLFNLLTGNNARTGNYPGITVDVAEGKMGDIKIADLPGIYSLSARSREEEISAEFLRTKPDVIVNVLDANCIGRGLYLTMQLGEYGIPMIVVLNMMDEAEKKGKINAKELERNLGVPVLPVSARQNRGCDILKNHIKENKARRLKKEFSCGVKKGQERAEFYYKKTDGLSRYFLLKEDGKISFADRILTGKISGSICFVCILAFILYVTFALFGKTSAEFIEKIFAVMCEKADIILDKTNVSPLLKGIICDGILSGTGSVISFLPCTLMLSFLLGIAEDSGYMSRVAFIFDGPMRRVGLSGKAPVPFIFGTGCTVPALLSCRTVEENRLNTALAVPFVPCSARLPIYFMLAEKFFAHPFVFVAVMYALGFSCAIISASISSKGTPPPFLMELSPYRIPKISTQIKNTCDKAFDFIKRTFSVILLASVAVYLLSNLTFSLKFSSENSILQVSSKCLLPAFSLMGINSWQCVASLISGISAKEAIISTLTVLGSENAFNMQNAVPFGVFVTLYTPCIASLSLIKKEYGVKYAVKSAVVQTFTAYVAGVIAYFTACLFLK